MLSDFTWSRIGELTETADIISKYEQVNVLKQPLTILYQLNGKIEGEHLKFLKTAILREAEIRLFNCSLNIQYKERN